jgi:hypothetical protein
LVGILWADAGQGKSRVVKEYGQQECGKKLTKRGQG